MITLAVGAATAAHYLLDWIAPHYIGLAPMAGFISNLLWIWNDNYE